MVINFLRNVFKGCLMWGFMVELPDQHGNLIEDGWYIVKGREGVVKIFQKKNGRYRAEYGPRAKDGYGINSKNSQKHASVMPECADHEIREGKKKIKDIARRVDWLDEERFKDRKR